MTGYALPQPFLAPSPAQVRAFRAYLHALSEGNGGKQAAADCGIAYQTFRNSIEEAYRRLGVTNAIQAAVQLGLLVPSNE
jgi:Bacterial regulatory proteins, luxR family